jgi:hypothetical protein
MSKVAFMVIKPFTTKIAGEPKAFEKGKVLHLPPIKATRLVQTGHLALHEKGEEQIKATVVSKSLSKAPLTYCDLLVQHEKRIKTLVQYAGLNAQTASTYAAESTISSLRRLRALDINITPPPIGGQSSKSKNRFNRESTDKGVGEWAQYSYNIAQGCQNGCVYCYAKGMAVRFGRIDSDTDWGTSTIQEEKMAIHERVDGTVMFPSTHDITSSNLDACIQTLANILQAGNRVLVVSKPSLHCIKAICQRFANYRNHLSFRFTIGTTDNSILQLLEPNAPLYEERIACLEHAYELGFSTSVSSEPLLGGIQTALAIYLALEPYVSDSIWYGKVNRPPAKGYPQEVLGLLDWIKQAQQDDRIRLMHEIMKDYDKVRWKDSIQKVVS